MTSILLGEMSNVLYWVTQPCNLTLGTLQEVSDCVRGWFLWKGQPTNTYRTCWAFLRALEGQQNQKRFFRFFYLKR